jgi:cobalt/nickel transport system ATP-binding protein
VDSTLGRGGGSSASWRRSSTPASWRRAAFEHTRILATHDLDMAAELCGRVIVLSGGTIVADGPAEHVFTDDRLLEASGLERPLGMQTCPACGAR